LRYFTASAAVRNALNLVLSIRVSRKTRDTLYNARIPFFRRSPVKFFSDYINLILIALAIVSGVLLLWPTLTRGRRGLSASDAITLINRRNAVVLDIRTPEAYALGHIPQARFQAATDLAAKAPQVAKNKATPVILVCQNGQQSTKAQSILKEAGYAEVYSLEGGLDGWAKAGMPVVSDKSSLKISQKAS